MTMRFESRREGETVTMKSLMKLSGLGALGAAAFAALPVWAQEATEATTEIGRAHV